MFHKSVDSITKGFTKMVAELDKLVTNHHNEIVATQTLVYKMNDDIKARKDEIIRAQAIKEKLNTILSV